MANFISPKNDEIPSPENILIGDGELRLACPKKKTIIMLVLMGVTFFPFAGVAARFMYEIFFEDPDDLQFDFKKTVIASCFILVLFVCGTLFNVLKSGDAWRYHATGREFTLSRPGCLTTIIFYKDVVVIDHEPLKFMGFINRGYRVTVRTTERDYEFKYVFPGMGRYSDIDDTPFGILIQLSTELRERSLDEILRDKKYRTSLDDRTLEQAFMEIYAPYNTETNNIPRKPF